MRRSNTSRTEGLPFAIVVHGGAGPHAPDRDERLRQGCARAVEAGADVLRAGGAALDAVIAAVEFLEEDPEFNAGRGSTLNRAGAIEVDACVMTGDRSVGAVAAVPWLRHPARLARLVMERGEHVLLCGDGALAFAGENGIEPDPPEELITPRARAQFLARSDARRDTVGACARDRDGRLAAATSTGGIAFKRPGRIGDSPLPGAGTWAQADAGAISATGEGEAIIRSLAARRAAELLCAGHSAVEAARLAVDEIARIGHGEGGLILVDRLGRVALASNAAAMPWASVVGDGRRADVLRRDDDALPAGPSAVEIG